ncbi:MAG: Arginine--tRNA ligase [Candidatus Dependentiae bacterium ADurb.Bin331]|nr:MAG: Arginine--tRNA ligase [Candidatus Dependentiae bacterium ADurb.Bin331]
MNLLLHLENELTNYILSAFKIDKSFLRNDLFALNVDEQKQGFGDLSSNIALLLAKPLGQQPRSIAQKIQHEFSHPFVSKIEIAGPGFLNIWLTPQAYVTLAETLFEQQEQFFKLEKNTQKHTFNVEFVSANPTGPLHLGHGRGGIIGDVLGNVLRFLGHSVTKEFYINDAGSQIQKLGASFKARCLEQLGFEFQLPEDGYQGEYLKELAAKCIAQYGSALPEKSDEFFAQYAKTELLEAIKKTLIDYGIHFDTWFSEKTLHDSGAITQSLKRLEERDQTYVQDHALWFRSTTYGDDKDRVVRKANGELTYAAADIAYLENKISRGFDKIVIVLGQDHHSYKQRLAGFLQALGYKADMLDVILYQLVTLKESGELVRMSKRAGKIVTLRDIIDTVGKDVARFFYLNRKADAHLDFDIDLALKKTEENPVYYVQYAYVRTGSIIQKGHTQEGLAQIGPHDAVNLGQEEQLLLKKIVSLKNLLEAISSSNQTHSLTYYVLELAQLFHSYYAKNRVIDAEKIDQSRARLLLIIILRNTFKTCLDLLGVSSPDKM